MDSKRQITWKGWDHGPIGGWTAAVYIDGVRHRVPSKQVPCGDGTWAFVAFDDAADARRHAIQHARNIVRVLDAEGR